MAKGANLKAYLEPKVLAIFFLGFSSGLPLALTASTLAAWLTEKGIDIKTIGLIAAVGLPYTLKFLWSPLIDRLPIPFFTKVLGRRRSWMLLTQAGLIISLLAMGFSDPKENITFTILMALMVSFFSASQDIVIDAYRVEYLDQDQYSAGVSMTTLGYRIGMLIAGAGALIMADHISWQLVYSIMAGLILVGTATVLIAGEPEISKKISLKEDSVASWIRDAVIAPFTDFMTRKGWWLILIFITLYKLDAAFAGVMTTPFLLKIGFTKTEIAGVVKTFGLAATLAGTALGGYVFDRMGAMRSLMVCGLLQMFATLIFIAQTRLGNHLPFLYVTITVENMATGMASAALTIYLMRLCNIKYTATQYALLSSLTALGRIVLSTPAGVAVETFGWEGFFIFSTLLGIPGLLALAILQRYYKEEK